jgi:hypothetical protein
MQLYFLKPSLFAFAILSVIYLMFIVFTGNYLLFIGIFAFLLIPVSGITWIMHWHYINYDKGFKVYSEGGNIAIENLNTGLTDVFSNLNTEIIEYYKRSPFPMDIGFLEPSFAPYYYVKFVSNSGAFVFVSCLSIHEHLFSLENTWTHSKLKFVERHMPFIKK